MKKHFPILFIAVTILGCSKQGTDIEWGKLHIEEGVDFRSITKQNDSLIVLGVASNAGKLVIIDALNLKTSPTSYSTHFETYSILKCYNAFYIGSDSAKLFYTTDFIDFKPVPIDSSNWINYFQQQPLYRLIEVEKDQQFFAAGGGNNGFGVTFNCFPKDNQWKSVEYNFEVRSAYYQSQQQTMWMVGNGILANSKKKDLSSSFNILELNNKYITDISFSNEKIGIATLHNGQLLITHNGGNTWDKIKNIPSNRFGKGFLNRIKWMPEIKKWVVVGNNGRLLWAEESAENWFIHQGFEAENLYDFQITENKELIIAGSNGKIFRAQLP